MFKRWKKNRAQSTLEYAALIGVIATAIVLMKGYVTKAYEGGLKKQADSIGKQFDPFTSSSTEVQRSFVRSNEKSENGKSGSGFYTESFSDESRSDSGELVNELGAVGGTVNPAGEGGW